MRKQSAIMTFFNERTSTLLYENIPLPFYSRKGWCWLSVRGELETGTGYHTLTPSFSEHSSTSFAFLLGYSTVGHWGPKALRLLLDLNSVSCPQLTPTVTGTRTDSSRLWHLVIFLYDTHLLSVGVRICHHHRIQPRHQVKVIFRCLQPDAPVFAVLPLIYTSASFDWRLGRVSICYTYIQMVFIFFFIWNFWFKFTFFVCGVSWIKTSKNFPLALFLAFPIFQNRIISYKFQMSSYCFNY